MSENQLSQISEPTENLLTERKVNQMTQRNDFYGQEHDNYIFIKFRNGTDNEVKVHKGKQNDIQVQKGKQYQCIQQDQEFVASSSEAGASGSSPLSSERVSETDIEYETKESASIPDEDDYGNIFDDEQINRMRRELFFWDDDGILQVLQDLDPELDLPIGFLKDKSDEPLYPCNSKVNGTCAICVESDIDTRERLCCQVPVCENCVTEYLKNEVNQRNVQIQCLNCESYVHRDEILALLPTELKEKYYQFLVDENCDPNTKTCPRCCMVQNKKDIIPDTSSISPKKRKKKSSGHKVICSKCQLTWCFDCHAPWHENIKCRDFRKGDKLVRDWAKEFSYGQKNAIKCPKCKVFIQKRSGCNHMTCTNCQTNFCYRCGNRYIQMKLIGKHSDRFSPFGCKYNLLPDKPVARRAVRGSVLCGKIFGGILLGGLIVAAAAVFVGGSIIIVPSYFGVKYYSWRQRQKIHKKYLKQRERLNIIREKNEKEAIKRSSKATENPSSDLDPYNSHSDTMTSTESSSSNEHQRSTEVKVWVHSEESEIDVNLKSKEQQTTPGNYDNTVTTAEVTMEDDVVVLHVKTTNQTDPGEVTNSKQEQGHSKQEVDGSLKENDTSSNSDTNDENANEVSVDSQGCFVKILGKLPVKWEKEDEKEGKLKENTLTGKPSIVKEKRRKIGTRRQRNQTDGMLASEYENADNIGTQNMPVPVDEVTVYAGNERPKKSEKILDEVLVSEIQQLKVVCDAVDPHFGVVSLETCDTVF